MQYGMSNLYLLDNDLYNKFQNIFDIISRQVARFFAGFPNGTIKEITEMEFGINK